LTVSDKASVKQELTPVFESFRQQLDKVSAAGDTVIYDALDTARRMLANFRNDLPKLRKRIVIVTDGADTSSESSARDVCHALQKSGIIVDSVQVGDRSDSKLHAISVATGAPSFSLWDFCIVIHDIVGGYRFCPRTSLSDALSIFVRGSSI
jgi:Mg-chelatase subunit ChlD